MDKRLSERGKSPLPDLDQTPWQQTFRTFVALLARQAAREFHAGLGTCTSSGTWCASGTSTGTG